MYNPHELYHHGILGQKWGVRRFQNKDGTLTSAGKKRKAKLEAQYESITGKKIKTAPAIKPPTVASIKKQTELTKAKNDLMDAELASRQKYSELNSASNGNSENKPESVEDIRKQVELLRAKNDLLDAQLNNRKKNAELNPPTVNKGKEFVKAQGTKLLNSVIDVGIDVGKKWATNYLTEKFIPESEGEKLKRIADNMKYKSDIAKYQSDIKKYTSPQKEDKYEQAKRDADYSENIKKRLSNERQIEKLEEELKKRQKELGRT